VGQELGVSHWHEVTQDAINCFADLTGDHQWIHVDVERAAELPSGGTIAHGYYTLSMMPWLAASIYQFEGFEFILNYGLNRVRFPSPMPVGGRLRLRATLASVEDVEGGVQASIALTVERAGGQKPVCVAETLLRFYD